MKANYRDAVRKEFDEINLRYTLRQKDGVDIYSITIAGKMIPHVAVNVRVGEDGDVKLWDYFAENVPDNKRAKVLEMLNNFSAEYRFVKFYIDSDNDVCASYDLMLFGEENGCGKQVSDALFMVARIIDQSIPELLSYLWKEEPEKPDDDNAGDGETYSLFESDEE